MALAKKNKKYTVHDYFSWDDGERWELIGGHVYGMTPAPRLRHQDVVLNFGSVLNRVLKGQTCKPFVAPTDVVLSDEDVVQPDVLVVCDPKKMEGDRIEGAPDFIAEVLSPSTAAKDRREKRALYEAHGVKEYWLVDPDARLVERYLLKKGKYGVSEVLLPDQTVDLPSLKGVSVALIEIFGEEKPKKPVNGPPKA